MKKALLILGAFLFVGIIFSLVNIKTNFSYSLEDGATVNVKAGVGNLSFNSSSTKSIVSGYLNHKIFSKPNHSFISNKLDIAAKKANGEINLPDNVNFSNISLALGAGNLEINLKSAQVSNFSVNSGASNIKLFLPQDSSSKFDFVVGAGNLSLVVPTKGKLEGIKILSTSLSNANLGNAWVQTPNGIQTVGFEKAKITSVIDLTKGGPVRLDITADK